MVHPVLGANSTDSYENWNETLHLKFVRPIWGLWGSEPWRCKDWYNEQLNNATEADKVASSAASTIMALLPSLLAFSPIVTTKIGLLRTLSYTQGFIAAAFTFGLPVQQLEIMTSRSVTSIKKLMGNAQSQAGDPIPSTDTNNSTAIRHRLSTDNFITQGADRDIELMLLEASSSSSSDCGEENYPPSNSNPTNHRLVTRNLIAQGTDQDIGSMLLGAGISSSSDCSQKDCTQESVDISTSSHNHLESFNNTVEVTLSPIKQRAFDCKRLPCIWVQALMYVLCVMQLYLIWGLVVISLFVDPSNVI